jgi:hypothetical protein
MEGPDEIGKCVTHESQSVHSAIIEPTDYDSHTYQRCFEDPKKQRPLTEQEYLRLQTTHRIMIQEQERAKQLIQAGTGFFRGDN